jgi:hypothetical protein
VVQFAVLLATTLGIIAYDRGRRFARGARSLGEPEMGTLLIVALLCNVACLPYYFYQTRGSIGAALIGFLLFLGCVVAMVIAGSIVAVATAFVA